MALRVLGGLCRELPGRRHNWADQHRPTRVCVTARNQSSGGCQWSATAVAPPSTAGTNVRVVLAPSRSRAWCVGTFHGTVWDVITLNYGWACPASLPPSGWIGKFTFRVTPE